MHEVAGQTLYAAAIAAAMIPFAALVHLQLSAWLFPSWTRALYVESPQNPRTGVAMLALAWIAAAVIIGSGVGFMLSWIPSTWGSVSEDGGFYSYSRFISGLAGVFMGVGWIWSLLQAGRRNAEGYGRA